MKSNSDPILHTAENRKNNVDCLKKKKNPISTSNEGYTFPII